jgi:hypothetical protein
MDQDRGGTEWISEFLEWTFSESDRSPGDMRAHIDSVMAIEAEGEIAEAYLEWIDASPVAAAAVRSQFGFDRRGVVSNADVLDLSREGILLMALRTEADCVHMLRQVLEMDGAGAGNLRLAIEGLEDAQRLLEGEQRAWHALMDVREAGWTTPERFSPAGFDQEWPSALNSVAAEVRALAGKVLAMHPH